jgi:hypothetical protein
MKSPAAAVDELQGKVLDAPMLLQRPAIWSDAFQPTLHRFIMPLLTARDAIARVSGKSMT